MTRGSFCGELSPFKKGKEWTWTESDVRTDEEGWGSSAVGIQSPEGFSKAHSSPSLRDKLFPASGPVWLQRTAWLCEGHRLRWEQTDQMYCVGLKDSFAL